MINRDDPSESAACRKHWSVWGERPPQGGLRIKNVLSAIVLATASFLLVANYMA